MSNRNQEASTTISAPAATIFDILADPRQHPRIDGSGTVRAIVSGPDRLSLDATFGMDMKQGASYKIGNKVVEFEEGRLIAWRHKGLHRWRYQLEPTEGGTRVTETWDLSRYPAPIAMVLSALMGSRTEKAIVETLSRLKKAAESDAD